MADTTKRKAKNALNRNTPRILGAQEVLGGGQMIKEITGTNI